ncbi:papilin [Aplysia californica]|uniref:Papilin n=1 Tax=Aplysia californica TaxID=6500 RepID=A0ABM1AF97_APLCA|nr:papilin [Aplysia californica]
MASSKRIMGGVTALHLAAFLAGIALVLSQSEDGWGPWSDYSECSRTCGGGVQQSTRQCRVGRVGSPECQGHSIQYQSCNMEECPPGSLNFRAYQCSTYNSVEVAVEGKTQRYLWKPYYDPSSPCSLICKNEYGQLHTLRDSAVDGTWCDNGDSFGVCVAGFCKPVGCDHKLGSVRAEDRCLVCGGYGENCETITGTTLDQDLRTGDQTEITTIPLGATKISISITSTSPSALELTSAGGDTLKLTEALITFGQRKLADFAGTRFSYYYLDDGMKFTGRGPVNDTLRLLVRFMGLSPLVEYEYSIPKSRVQEADPEQRYSWVFGGWTSCSNECGVGYQLRAISCMDRELGRSVSPRLCPRQQMPDRNQTCNHGPCPNSLSDGYKWVPGHWGECSVDCGVGEQTQLMHCIETGVTGDSIYAEDDLCTRYVGAKPEYRRACQGEGESCAYWATGPWNECSVTCGYGRQQRRVYCQRDAARAGSVPQVMDDDHCSSESRPKDTEICTLDPCPDGSNTNIDLTPSNIVQDCRRSRFGCCPDRVTPAKGDNMFGCEDKRPARVDPCQMPSDRGTCSDYTIKWYFDVNEKECLRFWYGGCEGNGNRFDDRDSCRNQCLKKSIKPEGSSLTCEGSQYGCCADGRSYARGPNKDGCPEKNLIGGCAGTRHGCCEDGVTSARGPEKEGCPEKRLVGGCAGTRHGCCEDGVTSARGPEKEGCPERRLVGGCAGTRHGCCEDGVTSARGPEKEGCPERRLVGGCAGTRHGCCEDGVTSARGPEKEGCPEKRLVGGCAGTRHGCCEDGVTSARGPEKEGCPEKRLIGGCAGTRFGCCNDGVSAARGENNLGCAENPYGGCSVSEHGCCEDGVTMAKGPGREGCPETIAVASARSCEASTYGCCPDGVTDAQGPNEAGCSSFDHASCALAKNPGTCTDYKLKWYFHADFGMCRQFWYGGCEGNANRFESEEECRSRCIDVGGTDICRLPVVKGPCRARKRRFHYDAASGRCNSFFYGGCKGNKNNFNTQAQCENTCKNVDKTERQRCNKQCLNGGSLDQDSCTCQCTMSYTGEMCQNAIPRPCDSLPCQNGFTCQDYLNATYSCSCSPDWGQNCERPPTYWCFSDDECRGDMKCVRERECSSGYCNIYAKCTAPSVSYQCDRPRCPRNQDCVNDDSFEDGYFCVDKIEYRRQNDVVLGCDVSRFGCCRDRRTAASGPNYEGCRETPCEYTRYGCCRDRRTAAQGPDFEGCDDTVEGSAEVPCEETRYGCCSDGVTAASGPRGRGCEDTPDSEDRGGQSGAGSGGDVGKLEPTEGPMMEKCVAPKRRELCTKYEVKWRFDDVKQECERHWWGGCRDNGNVFDSQEECEVTCLKNVVITDPGTGDPDFVSICDMPQDTGPCRAYLQRYFYDPRERACNPFTFGGCGGNENNFMSLEECQKECMGVITPVVTTTQAPVPETLPPPVGGITLTISGENYVNEGTELKVACQSNDGSEEALTFYLDGNLVRPGRAQILQYKSVVDDRVVVVNELVIQRASPRDAGTYVCRSQSGELESLNVIVITRSVPTTTTTTEAPYVPVESSIAMNGSSVVSRGSEIRVVCRAQGSRRPSTIDWFINGRVVDDRNSVDSYADPRALNALISELTIRNAQEDHEGTYYCRSRPYGDLDKMVISVRDEPEVITRRPTEEITESSDPAVVCMMEKATGNCYASFPKWYYDHQAGECKEFTYGGCGGNSNNFQSEEQCNRFCTASDVCTQPKEIGRCRAAMPRFFYDSQTRSCRDFIYGGCGGNLNNFNSMEGCQRKCASYIQGRGNTGGANVRVVGGDTDTDENVCELRPEKGNCRGYNIVWYYSSARNRCARFVYTGCEGNGNRFDNEADCEVRCLRTQTARPRQRLTQRPRPPPTTTTESNIIPESRVTEGVCQQTKDGGNCADYVIKWYYDSQRKYCLRFYYGGCGGNENRFDTEEECESRCVNTAPATPRPYTTPRPRPVSCQYSRYGCCSDGITAAVDVQSSNCGETNVIVQPGEDDRTIVRVTRGADAFLKCTLTGQDVIWIKDGYTLAYDRRYQVFQNWTLALRSVSYDMAGYYACRSTYGFNQFPVVEKFKVEVNEPMNILPGPALVSVRPGESAYFHCQASGSPTPRLSWQREGRVLNSRGRMQVFGNGTLIIDDVEPRDTGMYECFAENGIVSPVRRKIELTLRESIQADIQQHQGSFMEGSAIRLFCQGNGYPQPQVEWVKEGSVMTSGGKVSVRGGELVIQSASIEDAGVYKCVVTNGRSQDEDVTTVHIKFHTPQAQCTDTMRATKCRLIVAGRLCGFRMFATKCCRSCRRAGHL